jgi:flagellar biosynthesis anti-sigma factor FlgM
VQLIDKVQPNIPAGYLNNINQVESQRGAVSQTDKGRQLETSAAEVSISDDALAMQRHIQAVKDTPDVRADIVQAVKTQIQAGTYEVDVNSLAEKLLPFMK